MGAGGGALPYFLSNGSSDVLAVSVLTATAPTLNSIGNQNVTV